MCLGEVDLGNGLAHFVESDATAGTLEERALVKAFDDGDPATIDVFIVPSFDQSGRIGESFIADDGAAIQNTVIIDRAAAPIPEYVKSIGMRTVVESLFCTVNRESSTPLPSGLSPTFTL